MSDQPNGEGAEATDEVRRLGHRLLHMSASGMASCECGKPLELLKEDIERICRARSSIWDALLDAHNAHLAAMAEQGR